MKERNGTVHSFLRRVYAGMVPWLDSDSGVEISPLSLGFSVCFRHDMDSLQESHLEQFIEQEGPLEASSTLFFLESQWRAYGSKIRSLNPDKYECALHSEAKPSPRCWALFQLSGLVERAYARRLKRQCAGFRSRVGEVYGHAAHAGNNYLPFQSWINWNIIENASLRCGFSYVSDWRLPCRMAEGEEFLPPWTSYLRQKSGSQILVLTTSWDDKYFMFSYEDLQIRKLATAETAYRPRSAEDGFASVMRQAEHCRRLDTPLVLNIHPWHTIGNGQSQFLELKRLVIEWCRSERVPIMRCKDYLPLAAAG
jgi:hypothetical protein